MSKDKEAVLDIIRVLESLLKRAQNGDIESICILGMNTGDKGNIFCHALINSNEFGTSAMIGGLNTLTQQMINCSIARRTHEEPESNDRH